MSQQISKSAEGRQTIPVPRDGVTVSQLRLSLWHLVDVTLAKFMGTSKSVQIDAPELQLLITVSAIGAQQMNESLTSTTQPGDWSPQSLSLEDSSELPFARSELRNQMDIAARAIAYQTQHTFEGRLLGNCNICRMPLSASQHYDLYTHSGIIFRTEVLEKKRSDRHYSEAEDPALD
jgi:hypothetical protein